MRYVLVVFLLAGCGSQGSEERGPAAPDSCTVTGPSGTCVSFQPGSLITDIQFYEENYVYVENCMGLGDVPGPVVLATSELINGVDGVTDMNNGQVSIYHPWAIRHEYVHYILWKTGYPNDRNKNHDHPAFVPGSAWCAS